MYLRLDLRRPKQLCSTSCKTNAVLPVPGRPVTTTPDDWGECSSALLMSCTSHSRPKNNGSDSCWGTSKNSGFNTSCCCCWHCCCCGDVLYWANLTGKYKAEKSWTPRIRTGGPHTVQPWKKTTTFGVDRSFNRTGPGRPPGRLSPRFKRTQIVYRACL